MENEELDEMELSENESTIILLNDEDNNEMPFEFLDLIEYENEEYVVLLPLEEEPDEEDDEVVILKLETTDEEEETYIGVDDEAVLEAVFEIFKQRNDERFNFVD